MALKWPVSVSVGDSGKGSPLEAVKAIRILPKELRAKALLALSASGRFESGGILFESV